MTSYREQVAKALEERGIGDIEARAIAPLVEAAIEAVIAEAAENEPTWRDDGRAAALSALGGRET